MQKLKNDLYWQNVIGAKVMNSPGSGRSMQSNVQTQNNTLAFETQSNQFKIKEKYVLTIEETRKSVKITTFN